MTNPYTIDIDPIPTPIQLPSPLVVPMADQQSSAPAPREATREELLVQAMSFLDHKGFDTVRRDLANLNMPLRQKTLPL